MNEARALQIVLNKAYEHPPYTPQEIEEDESCKKSDAEYTEALGIVHRIRETYILIGGQVP